MLVERGQKSLKVILHFFLAFCRNSADIIPAALNSGNSPSLGPLLFLNDFSQLFKKFFFTGQICFSNLLLLFVMCPFFLFCLFPLAIHLAFILFVLHVLFL